MVAPVVAACVKRALYQRTVHAIKSRHKARHPALISCQPGKTPPLASLHAVGPVSMPNKAELEIL